MIFSHAIIKIVGQNLALLIHHPLTIFTTIVHPSPYSSSFFLYLWWRHAHRTIFSFLSQHKPIHSSTLPLHHPHESRYSQFVRHRLLYDAYDFICARITTFRKYIIIKLYQNKLFENLRYTMFSLK